MHDAVIVLSHLLTPGGGLSDQMRERIDQGLPLLYDGKAARVIMTGGLAQKEIPHTHAERMSAYARPKILDQGMPLDDVLLSEETSLDTVGQAAFVLRDIVIPNNFGDLAVVSSTYHIPRVQVIFNLLYGNDFRMDFIGAPSAVDDDPATLQGELKRIPPIVQTWRDVRPGDPVSIFERLYSAHALYKGGNDVLFPPRVTRGHSIKFKPA